MHESWEVGLGLDMEPEPENNRLWVISHLSFQPVFVLERIMRIIDTFWSFFSAKNTEKNSKIA